MTLQVPLHKAYTFWRGAYYLWAFVAQIFFTDELFIQHLILALNNTKRFKNDAEGRLIGNQITEPNKTPHLILVWRKICVWEVINSSSWLHYFWSSPLLFR